MSTQLDLDDVAGTSELAKKELQELREENASLHALFNMQHSRVREAEQLWRDCNPGNELVTPDLGKLVQWLMDERVKLKAEANRLAEALKPFAALGKAMGNSRPGSTSPDSVVYGFNHAELTNADLIEARAALAAHEEGKDV